MFGLKKKFFCMGNEFLGLCSGPRIHLNPGVKEVFLS